MALSVALPSFLGFVVVSQITRASLQELLRPVWLAARAALWACVPVVLLGFFPPVVSPWFVLVGSGLVMAVIYMLAVATTYGGSLTHLLASTLQHLRR